MIRTVVAACLICLTALAVGGCKSPFRRLPESEVDAGMKLVAERVATKILESERDGVFEPLGDEATAAVRSGLTPEVQKESYESIKGMGGDFQSLEYAEPWVPTDGSLLVIYRFRGRFSKSDARPEIRVVMDGEGKLAGLWLKPWKSRIQ
ncbi:hypothetical protein E3J38_04290 [candidate division TA06 bacterium]|uniref:DUF3887 domain-containing protein n=1 Tax=candidate division TA06 bacterium TaxID=2250710 RepID=A0A523XPJ7_UNCT6|nr:MAG: hypothetical protein E3J38_04290 [candidate division TA06 bacterium]